MYIYIYMYFTPKLNNITPLIAEIEQDKKPIRPVGMGIT